MTRLHAFTERRTLAYFDLRKVASPGWEEQVGTYVAKHGIVDVVTLSKVDGRRVAWTDLTAVAPNGEIVRRSWRRVWAKRTIARLCRQLLEDIKA